MIVGDFFSHSSGSFFTVDSYSTIDYESMINIYCSHKNRHRTKTIRGRFLLHDDLLILGSLGETRDVSSTFTTDDSEFRCR